MLNKSLALTTERRMSAPGVIYQLVRDDYRTRTRSLGNPTDRIDGDNLGHASLPERVYVCTIVNFMRRNMVLFPVTRQERKRFFCFN